MNWYKKSFSDIKLSSRVNIHIIRSRQLGYGLPLGWVEVVGGGEHIDGKYPFYYNDEINQIASEVNQQLQDKEDELQIHDPVNQNNIALQV